MDKAIQENNFYKILHISYDATPSQIKKAYNKLSLLFHPDRYPTKKGELKKLGYDKQSAEEVFKKISVAHATLSDSEKKSRYDSLNARMVFEEKRRQERKKQEALRKAQEEESREKKEKMILKKKEEEQKNKEARLQREEEVREKNRLREAGLLKKINVPLEEWSIEEEYIPASKKTAERDEAERFAEAEWEPVTDEEDDDDWEVL